MFNLYVLKETFTNGFRLELLDILYIVSPFLGIFTIVSKNPIVSVLFLICLFLNISCYLMALGLNFLGLSYLLVYVGAVSILFLFILMLINVRVSELLSDTNKSIPLGILLVILFIVPVYGILPFDLSNQKNLLHYTINLFQDSQVKELIYIFFVTNGMWDGNLAECSHITSIGNIMYSSYSIWLIITSIILLLAMVGAIIITIKQKP